MTSTLAVHTGQSISPVDVGPIYPLVGWEPLMFVACVVFCVVFMVWKFRMENTKYTVMAARLRKSDVLSKTLAVNHPNDHPVENDQPFQ